MRLKHNKKRNTAFLFEVITREYVKAVVKGNANKQSVIRSLIHEHFCKASALSEELSLYREILETSGMSQDDASSLLTEVKNRYDRLDKKGLFLAQSKLIKEMNYKLSQDVLNNFVPNYKDIATVYNIFNNKTSAKEKILLERRIVEEILSSENDSKNQAHIDNLTYKTFVKKFNEKYSDLPKEQRDLLTNYIASFADNSLGLKNYLNEQISELKTKLKKHESDPALENEELKGKYDEIVSILEGYHDQEINDSMIVEVLKIQDVVRELENVN